MAKKPRMCKHLEKNTAKYLHGPQGVDGFHLGDQFEQPAVPLSPVRVPGAVLAHEQVGIVLCDLVGLLGAVFAGGGVEELQDEWPLRHQDAGDENLQLLQTRDLNLERKEFV